MTGGGTFRFPNPTPAARPELGIIRPLPRASGPRHAGPTGSGVAWVSAVLGGADGVAYGHVDTERCATVARSRAHRLRVQARARHHHPIHAAAPVLTAGRRDC